MVSAARNGLGGGGAGIRQSRVGPFGELDAAAGTGVGLSRVLTSSPLLSPLSLTMPPPLAIAATPARTRSSFGGGGEGEGGGGGGGVGGGASVSVYSASACSSYSSSKRSLPPPPLRQTSHVSSNLSQCQSYQSQQSQQSASGNEFPFPGAGAGGSNLRPRPPQQVFYRRTSAERAGSTAKVQQLQLFASGLQSDRIAPLGPPAPRTAVNLLRRLPNARTQHSSSSSERDCELCESSANPECAHYKSNDLSFDVYASLRRQEEVCSYAGFSMYFFVRTYENTLINSTTSTYPCFDN